MSPFLACSDRQIDVMVIQHALQTKQHSTFLGTFPVIPRSDDGFDLVIVSVDCFNVELDLNCTGNVGGSGVSWFDLFSEDTAVCLPSEVELLPFIHSSNSFTCSSFNLIELASRHNPQ
eukprot:TRINITY_DN1666_c0_g1_i2.p1 TRINITY_DN1666_c0_g1~~TRINITY_DN1666_c0_g1_i2.p1  ORF type:complete len:118 (+),score=23.22 TRINITY_DN1666_c0_g1_i2:328-681(+)